MGVPSFYRWLSNRYPNIVANAIEDNQEPLDTSFPNPNGFEFDNFYIDMNGIVHPCFHPDDTHFSPTTFEEVFCNIYAYIDRLFNIVRPRNLLFLAVDGVAPRAKMNQQRSRRFRAAKDIEMAEEIEEKLRDQFELEGKVVLPKEESQLSDSNIITPGTEFMYILSKKLESYIKERMTNDAGWRNIKVILSDASVPGEGEHKIMSYIRAQRSHPGYDPNTRHCLYGLDADLIMLALATHEVHFSIVREDVILRTEEVCARLLSLEKTINEIEASSSSSSLESGGWFKEDQKNTSHVLGSANLGMEPSASYAAIKKKPYQFLHVWILREYLALDFKILSSLENVRYDLERVVDDFIFICFFAGNDFLPHMPTLEIHEGAIDLLIYIYKGIFEDLGGYLVDMERVHSNKMEYIKLKRVEKFILRVGEYEEKIFAKRCIQREKKLKHISNECADVAGKVEMDDEEDGISPSSNVCSAGIVDEGQVLNNTKELKQKLKDQIRDLSDSFKNTALLNDKVKFGMEGWRKRYYKEKFSAETPTEVEDTRKVLVTKYGEGLCWVLQYYFTGVPSWDWFYPFHYGPLASDLKGLSSLKVKFEKGLPFKPFDQLMAVLPPRSIHALPIPYGSLMTDEKSNIIEFYPKDYETDMDGKRYVWQGVCKLPFIDEKRLLNVTTDLEKDLKEHEKERNLSNFDRLFMRKSTEQGQKIISTCLKACGDQKDHQITNLKLTLNGINCSIRPVAEEQLIMAEDENIICVCFEIDQSIEHIPRVLEGVNFPVETVIDGDIMETKLWHEHQTSRFRNESRPNHLTSTRKANWDGWSQKGDGTGFSLGRGRNSMAAPHVDPYNIYRHAPSTIGPVGELSSYTHAGTGHWRSGSGWDSRNRHHEVCASSQAGYGSTSGWRMRPELVRFEGLAISHSRKPVSCYRGPHPDWNPSNVGANNRQPTAGAWQRGFSDAVGQTRGYDQPTAWTEVQNRTWTSNSQQPNAGACHRDFSDAVGQTRGYDQPTAWTEVQNRTWTSNSQQPNAGACHRGFSDALGQMRGNNQPMARNQIENRTWTSNNQQITSGDWTEAQHCNVGVASQSDGRTEVHYGRHRGRGRGRGLSASSPHAKSYY